MIPFNAILWDDATNPRGNVQHIAAHNLTPDDVESVLRNPNGRDDWSRASNLPMRFGRTPDGRFIAIIYRVRQTRASVAIKPVTAYEVNPY